MKEQAHERNRAIRLENLKTFPNSFNYKDITTKYPWYLIEPTYSCEHVDRVGDVIGDGAKFVCNAHHLRQQTRCLYYGVGVDGEVHFEEAFVKLFASKPCEMFAFDPVDGVTIGNMPKFLNQTLGIHFEPWGLNDVDGEFEIGWSRHQGFTLDTIKRKLGHVGRTIDILKMVGMILFVYVVCSSFFFVFSCWQDVEGSEWRILAHMLANCDRDRPAAHQILVEFHSPHVQTFLDLMAKFDECGFRLFSKDVNFWCPHCIELAFVHERFVKCQID